MRSSVTLLLLQLWGTLAISVSQRVCSRPPVFPHAFVAENSQKTQYVQGDVIYYTCETGYSSGLSIKYICSSEGWMALRKGNCALKPCQLPEDVPNGHYDFIRGDDFVFGAAIQYRCEEGYQMMSKETIRTCMANGWTNRPPVCEPSSCDPPDVKDGLIVKGLDDNEDLILPGRFLSFSCSAEGKRLNGSSQLVCGKNGQWDHPFPNCEDVACKVDALTPNLKATEFPANNTVKVGHKITFHCNQGFALVGSETVQCSLPGQWNHPFPTCSESCVVRNVSQSVKIVTQNVHEGAKLTNGAKIRFACKSKETQMKGAVEIKCLGQGAWSAAFPTCALPQHCPPPPYVPDGDIEGSLKDSYAPNERVTYICPPFYIIENNLKVKTCTNGQWDGSVRCLRPCTVNRDDMNRHNIRFRFKADDKLYATHGEFIEFACLDGRRHDGNVAVRQQCIDGVMHLPTCI